MKRYLLTVRYGAMCLLGEFLSEFAGIRAGDKVVVRTNRGVEMGTVVAQKGETENERVDGVIGQVLRKATPRDLQKQQQIEEEIAPKEQKFCEEKIKELGLPMKLAYVEHLFGGTKIIFYFLADGRVDFRQLVKELAREYRARIEMRQIGVRDEARLLADFEHCGQEICCRRFMRKLEPVTMKMAKNQKATLDPAKISGRCGRLMCCLRFEDEMYEELKRQLPKKGTWVVTDKGAGEVTEVEILQQTVKIETEDGRELVVSRDEIKEQLPNKRKRTGNS